MKEKQSIASKLYLVIFLLSLILLFYNIPLGCWRSALRHLLLAAA